jgi:hypothetical protein
MAGKQSGHSRLKSALVLRDALLDELGLSLISCMPQLSQVETSFGAARGLDEEKYLEAALSVCEGDTSLLRQLHGEVRTACAKVQLAPRYAQYLALILFTHWMHMRQTDPEAFVARLNEALKNHLKKDSTEKKSLTDFTERDLQYAAFWMATASGKTHVLHACLALLTENRGASWARIFIVTPGDALTRQHAEKLRELNAFPVFAYPMDGDHYALKSLPRETVIVIDINKLATQKADEGIRIPTSAFKDDCNLVFVDEGHKGQKSELSLWKRLQQDLAGIDSEGQANRGLLIEFSATFGQVAETERAFDRYAKSVILDYAYDRFHSDHYGKDFWHVKMEGRGDAALEVQDQVLTCALLSFWHQLGCYRLLKSEDGPTDNGAAVSLPLWVLLGLSVIGGTSKSDQEQTSDVVAVLQFLKRLLAKPETLAGLIQTVKEVNVSGTDIVPGEVRMPVKRESADGLSHRILSDVFGWQEGDKPVFRLLKCAEGEMGLGLLRGDAVHYYGVVNVGNAGGLKKAMQECGLQVEDDAFTQSLFASLSEPVSDIHILIGSRRFAEGWDNYRPSSLTLLRLGVKEGSLIIQMFGRVVRFAGTNGDGKRLISPKPQKKPLQTAYIYGLRSSYLEAFLNGLYANGVPEPVGKSCDFKKELPEDVTLHSVKTITPKPAEFLVHIAGKRWLGQINKVKLSLTAAVYTSAITRDGVRTEKGTMGQDMTGEFKDRLRYVDLDRLYLELVEMKRQRGWWNFSFEFDAILEALNSDEYELWGLPSSLRIETDADLIRLNRTAATLVRRLFEGAYRREENRNSRYTWVDASESGIPKSYRKERLHVQN